MTGPILIVDDDAITRRMLNGALQRHGYQTVEAADGLEALTAMDEHDIRMVVSDWSMPNVDGLELTRRLRRGGFGGYIYIIMLTSRDTADATVEGLRAGADDFISKPFDPAELIARIHVGQRVLQLETREALIFSLAKLAESRDMATGEHIERVQEFSRCLAVTLSRKPKFAETITPQFIHLIHQTSPLHDIGKVGIPDQILLKPGRLTAEEFEIIKSHPLIGAETLQGAIDRSPEASFLQMAHDITLSHHEKYDGTGYPHGLAGEAIPLSARIVALADVYDALTSDRVYKKAFEHDRAAEIILGDRGTHFDPDVVDAFIDSQSRFQEIVVEYNPAPAASISV